ncbi:SLOG family protein [Mycobacterium sp. IS-1556]|uniref:SLOG family protein n=1 Tax=Mycobacterium sp. IS-1556 TaxID=1772276 RepID=UPI0009E97826|nr:SLOG family protein [Mycobacterium sp. IS-1556]
MRVVLVTGARNWPDDHIVWGVLSEQVVKHGPFVLVHGGTPVGVDALAHEWLYIEDPACDLPCCDPHNQQLMRRLEESYPIDLRTDGVAGIASRNQRMVDRGPDLCLAFISPASRGSVDCMTRAHIAGIPVVEHHLDPGTHTGPRAAVCCSACVHPAIDHDHEGCQVYGGLDECSCAGYQVDPMDLV